MPKLTRCPPVPPKQNTLTFKTKKISTSTSAFQFSPDEPSSTFAAEKTSDSIVQEKIKTGSSKLKTPRKTPEDWSRYRHHLHCLQLRLLNRKNRHSRKRLLRSAGWIALLLTIILFTILGYFTYSSIDSMNREIKDLQDDVISLKSELGAANNFITNYTSLIEFFNYKDITVVNLTSSDANEKSSCTYLTFV